MGPTISTHSHSMMGLYANKKDQEAKNENKLGHIINQIPRGKKPLKTDTFNTPIRAKQSSIVINKHKILTHPSGRPRQVQSVMKFQYKGVRPQPPIPAPVLITQITPGKPPQGNKRYSRPETGFTSAAKQKEMGLEERNEILKSFAKIEY